MRHQHDRRRARRQVRLHVARPHREDHRRGLAHRLAERHLAHLRQDHLGHRDLHPHHLDHPVRLHLGPGHLREAAETAAGRQPR